jgi:hypothetical protein
MGIERDYRDCFLAANREEAQTAATAASLRNLLAAVRAYQEALEGYNQVMNGPLFSGGEAFANAGARLCEKREELFELAQQMATSGG